MSKILFAHIYEMKYIQIIHCSIILKQNREVVKYIIVPSYKWLLYSYFKEREK